MPYRRLPGAVPVCAGGKLTTTVAGYFRQTLGVQQHEAKPIVRGKFRSHESDEER